MTRGAQTDDMGHLRAGDEGEARVDRKAEQLLQVLATDFLDDAGGRTAGVDRGVLIPSRGEPVGGEPDRERATDHPTEKAPARTPYEPTFDVGHEIVDDTRGIAAVVRERPTD